MQRARGFTLVELMITVALVAIIATVAVPAWSDFVRRNRLAAITNEFVTAINYARSEAVRRNTEVSLCPSSDQSTCVDTTDWSDGWIVFVGDDVTSPGTVLRAWGKVEGGGSLGSDATQVEYEGDGTAATQANFDLQLPGCSGDEHRDIAIGFVGRPDVQESECV